MKTELNHAITLLYGLELKRAPMIWEETQTWRLQVMSYNYPGTNRIVREMKSDGIVWFGVSNWKWLPL